MDRDRGRKPYTIPLWERIYGRWEIRVTPPSRTLPARGCRHAVLCDAHYRGTSNYVVATALGASLLGALLSLKTVMAETTQRRDGRPFDRDEWTTAVEHIEKAIGDFLASCVSRGGGNTDRGDRDDA